MVIHQTARSENLENSETPKNICQRRIRRIRFSSILTSILGDPQLPSPKRMILQLRSSIWLHLPWVIASPGPGIAHSWRKAPIICHWVSTPQGILQFVELRQRNEWMWLDMVGWWCWWWNMMDMCVKRVTTNAIGWRTSWISRLVIWFLAQWMTLSELFKLWPLGWVSSVAWQWPKTTQPQGHRRRAVERAPVGSHCLWPHLQAAPSALEAAEPMAGWRWWGQRAPRKANKLGKMGEMTPAEVGNYTNFVIFEFLICLLLFPTSRWSFLKVRIHSKKATSVLISAIASLWTPPIPATRFHFKQTK